MGRKFYFLMQEEKNGYFNIYVEGLGESDNLLKRFDKKNLFAVTICPTKKKAESVKKKLIEEFKEGGCYYMDEHYNVIWDTPKKD